MKTLSPLDFIYNEMDKTPNYLEAVLPVVYRDNSYAYRSISYANHANGDPILYNVTHSSHYDVNHYSSTQQQLFDYFNSFVPDPLYYSKEEIDLFFPGVRYLTPGIVVFERPPSYQHVDAAMAHRDNINDETGVHSWYLPIPWQVYVAIYNPETMLLVDVKMYFTNSSLFDSDQPVYAPPIFNFFSNGKLCRPFFGSSDDINKYPKTISGIIASAFDWIWNSGFNLDITENISHFLFSKKYTQFEPYCKTPEQIKNYRILLNNPLPSLPTTLSPGYFKPFFSCWESVPLDKISSFEWSPYSSAEFFYQELNNDDLSSYVSQYININDLVIHEEEEDDHYDSDGETNCPENCICLDDLYSSFHFRSFVSSKRTVSPKSIKESLRESAQFLTINKIAQKSHTHMSYNRLHVDGSELLSQSS